MTDAANGLVLTRVLDAPRDKLWRCWVEPELLKQWFCPKPWYVSEARIDLRPGGEFFTLMNGPDGEPLIRPGGQYSGVPDSTVGDWRQPLGTLSTDGTIRPGREAPYRGDGPLRRLTPFY